MTEITEAIAAKVLETVDAGLVQGKGIPKPGKMCVEAAVCYALGLPHSDDPACVSRAVRSLKIQLNDSNWSSDTARAKGLRRLALIQLGSAGTIDDAEFIKRVAEMTIRKIVPIALRTAADIHPDEAHKKALNDAALKCEAEGTKAASRAASEAARAASRAASAASEAASAASEAASAASWAARAASEAASWAASWAASRAASEAARWAARWGARWAASEAASEAASWAARWAASEAASDQLLSDFAENVVQILIDMKAPGTQWLWMTEE